MGYSYIPVNIFVRGTSGNSPGTSYKEKKKISKNTSQAAPGPLTDRLQCRTTCKIKNGHQGGPKWQRGSGKVFTPWFLGVPVNFR